MRFICFKVDGRDGSLLPRIRLFGGSVIWSWYKIFLLANSMRVLSSSSRLPTEHPGQESAFLLFALDPVVFKTGGACLTFDAVADILPGLGDGIFKLTTSVRHCAIKSNTNKELRNISE